MWATGLSTTNVVTDIKVIQKVKQKSITGPARQAVGTKIEPSPSIH